MTQTPPSPSKGIFLPLALILLLAAGGGVYYWGTSNYAPESVRALFAQIPMIGAGAPGTPATNGTAPAAAPPAVVAPLSTAPSIPPQTPPPAVSPTITAEPTPQLTESPSGTPPQVAPEQPAETTPAPGIESGQTPSQPTETGEAASKPTDTATPDSPDSTSTTTPKPADEPTAVPVIEYNKAKPIEADGPGVRGRVESKQPVDTDVLFGPSASRKTPGSPLPAAKGEDAMVRLEFVRALAQFLADNYWPAGTHPAARRSGATTAGVKLAGLTFGIPMHGFGVSPTDGSTGRNRVLQYALNREMLNALYTMYGKRFFESLAQAAAERRVPNLDGRPLTSTELAEMYTLYATQARSLAGTIRAYCAAKDLDARLSTLAAADDQAAEAYGRLLQSPETMNRTSLQQAYQQAVIKREHAREIAAATLRRAGDTRGMDTDSLVYVASWLKRRGPGKETAFRALADLLDRAAVQLEKEHPVLP